MDNEKRNPPTFSADWTPQVRKAWKYSVLPLLKLDQPLKWLEVGSFEGRSTLWAVENMLLHPESSMVCVDVWITWPEYDGRTNYNYEEVFDANVKGLTQVSKRKGPSKEVLPTLPAGSFHGCYIDGSHDEEDVLSDARLALPLMKPGAVMVFDDYEWPMGPGVKRAVDALLVEWASKVQVRHIGYQAVVQVNP